MIVCRDCGRKNHSGVHYCVRCSGDLFVQEHQKKVEELRIMSGFAGFGLLP